MRNSAMETKSDLSLEEIPTLVKKVKKWNMPIEEGIYGDIGRTTVHIHKDPFASIINKDFRIYKISLMYNHKDISKTIIKEKNDYIENLFTKAIAEKEKEREKNYSKFAKYVRGLLKK